MHTSQSFAESKRYKLRKEIWNAVEDGINQIVREVNFIGSSNITTTTLIECLRGSIKHKLEHLLGPAISPTQVGNTSTQVVDTSSPATQVGDTSSPATRAVDLWKSLSANIQSEGGVAYLVAERKPSSVHFLMKLHQDKIESKLLPWPVLIGELEINNPPSSTDCNAKLAMWEQLWKSLHHEGTMAIISAKCTGGEVQYSLGVSGKKIVSLVPPQ